MSWGEFCTLLSGLMAETPLGQIISVRSESDKDMLKNFTEEQHKIRKDWQDKRMKLIQVDKTEAQRQVKMIQEAMKMAFS